MKLLSETTRTTSGNSALKKLPSELPNIQKIQNSYPTFAGFSKKFNPDNLELCSRQPTKCVSCGSPTLTDINLAYGEGRAVAWLMAQLTTTQEKLSVPHKMTVFELESCAQTIYDSFHHLKATEIMLFLSRLLGGMYPVDWHGYVTPTKIVSALREHFIPWRNNLLYKIEKQEQERKAKEEASQPSMTWEEYCQSTGRDPSDNPLLRLFKQ